MYNATMKFEAEIKQIKSRKTASLDIEYTVTLTTNNPEVLSLGAISPDQLVKVEITPNA
jgi:hypothetical protein